MKRLQPEYPRKISIEYKGPEPIPLKMGDPYEPIPLNMKEDYDPIPLCMDEEPVSRNDN